MAKRVFILALSKQVERQVQVMLWPGTSRPWEARWDVAGPDAEGGMWYGEVKHVRAEDGNLSDAMRLLREAGAQLREAAPEDAAGLLVAIHVKRGKVWCWALAGPVFLGPYSLGEFAERYLAVTAKEEL